eukprot:2594094-Karenia_brevis.AAC.1
MNVLWGQGSRRRCKEVVMTLLCPGHRLDPSQFVLVDRMVQFHKMLSRRHDLHHVFRRTWAARHYYKTVGWGPVQLLYEAMEQLGWDWTSPFEITIKHGTTVDIRDVDEQSWAHFVRDGVRRM